MGDVGGVASTCCEAHDGSTQNICKPVGDDINVHEMGLSAHGSSSHGGAPAVHLGAERVAVNLADDNDVIPWEFVCLSPDWSGEVEAKGSENCGDDEGQLRTPEVKSNMMISIVFRKMSRLMLLNPLRRKSHHGESCSRKSRHLFRPHSPDHSTGQTLIGIQPQIKGRGSNVKLRRPLFLGIVWMTFLKVRCQPVNTLVCFAKNHDNA